MFALGLLAEGSNGGLFDDRRLGDNDVNFFTMTGALVKLKVLTLSAQHKFWTCSGIKRIG